jgi:hypothetical protein
MQIEPLKLPEPVQLFCVASRFYHIVLPRQREPGVVSRWWPETRLVEIAIVRGPASKHERTAGDMMVVNVLRKAVAAQTSSHRAGDGLRGCADRSRPLRARCILAGAIASVASDGISGALRRGSARAGHAECDSRERG